MNPTPAIDTYGDYSRRVHKITPAAKAVFAKAYQLTFRFQLAKNIGKDAMATDITSQVVHYNSPDAVALCLHGFLCRAAIECNYRESPAAIVRPLRDRLKTRYLFKWGDTPNRSITHLRSLFKELAT